MQRLQYFLFIVGVLLFNANDTISMDAVGTIWSLECFNKSNTPTGVLSLKRLCANKLVELIQEGNIDTLTSENTIKKILSLPEELHKKITQHIFCCKPGHEISYGKSNSIFGQVVMFDEFNSQVMLSKEGTLTIFTIDGKEINSFPWPKTGSRCQNGSLLAEQDYRQEGSLNIIKEGKHRIIQDSCSPPYCVIEKILDNQQEMICWDRGKYSLCDFANQQIIYKNADLIQFDRGQKVCMVRDGDKVIISTPKPYIFETTSVQLNDDNAYAKQVCENHANKYEQQTMLDGIKKAYLNPNGKQLLIRPKDRPVELIRIKDQKIVFSFKDFEGSINIHTVKFSEYGDYLVLSQFIPAEGLRYHVLDTKLGKICMSLRLPMHTVSSFDKQYFVLRRLDQVCLIPIKNLCKMSDFSKDASHLYTIEDIIERGVGKAFNNFQGFHPNGKHIVLRPDFQWQLVDPKTEKSVFVVDNILTHKFSEPTGKMFSLGDCWCKGCEVILLRNDFTVLEYLFLRFIAEKNITESDLPKYPHMQKIYNEMSKDKRLFYCLYDGRKQEQSQCGCVIS